MRENFKTIHILVEVPTGDYCWDGSTPCEHFDNERRIPRCRMNLDSVEPIREDETSGGYFKPKTCLNAMR